MSKFAVKFVVVVVLTASIGCSYFTTKPTAPPAAGTGAPAPAAAIVIPPGQSKLQDALERERTEFAKVMEDAEEMANKGQEQVRDQKNLIGRTRVAVDDLKKKLREAEATGNAVEIENARMHLVIPESDLASQKAQLVRFQAKLTERLQELEKLRSKSRTLLGLGIDEASMASAIASGVEKANAPATAATLARVEAVEKKVEAVENTLKPIPAQVAKLEEVTAGHTSQIADLSKRLGALETAFKAVSELPAANKAQAEKIAEALKEAERAYNKANANAGLIQGIRTELETLQKLLVEQKKTTAPAAIQYHAVPCQQGNGWVVEKRCGRR